LIQECFEDQDFIENPQETHVYGSIGLVDDHKKSDFYITFSDCQWMDGITPCFGRLYPYDIENEAFKTLKLIEKLPASVGGKSEKKIVIYECGQM
jgi:cyclophilin family peptidyl-prolyl cis-trans isomerase